MDINDPVVPTPHALGRRRVLTVAGAAGVATASAVVLAACGGSSDAGSNASTPQSSAAPSSSAPSSSAGVTVAASDVAVGGGVILDSGVVVVQPTAGDFKAYDSRCPHQGCAVSNVANGTITCPCHGSTFSATDGAVTNGPATTGLTARTATVDGDEVVVT